MSGKTLRVAIIGAGIAGAAAASTLREAGISVAVFDKGRSPGGRLSTRRRTVDGTEITFDHGAPVLGGHGPSFDALCRRLIEEGVVARWPVGGAPVALPGMNAVVKTILADAHIARSTHVRGLDRRSSGWFVQGETDRTGPFDAVIVTVPAPQAIALLAPNDEALAQAAETARYRPCWTGMFAFPGPLTALPSEDDFRHRGVERVVCDGTKPGRGHATLVLHADAVWSRDRLEDDKEAIAAAFQTVLMDAGFPQPRLAMAHRWRFAQVTRAAKAVRPSATCLAVAGDWTLGPTVADAYESGVAAAKTIQAQLI